jgi:hypothetical protein
LRSSFMEQPYGWMAAPVYQASAVGRVPPVARCPYTGFYLAVAV